MMGKKKAVKKTKEVSVALAESPSIEQQTTPRKRGRPRKISENSAKKEEELKRQEFSKKTKTSGGEEEEEEEEEREGNHKEKKLEDIGERLVGPSSKSEREEVKDDSKEATGRSTGRRKSKPRKSS